MSRLLNVGEQFPAFEKKAVVSLEAGKEFAPMSNNFANDQGRWTVVFWWPKDFSGLCPTELQGFNEAYEAFAERNAALIGASTDSEFVHLAWRRHDERLRDLRYPLLADTSKSLAEELGILFGADRVALRATFIIDPQNTVRWVSAYALNIGRSVEEVLRVLDALQTGGLCPVNWKKGQATL